MSDYQHYAQAIRALTNRGAYEEATTYSLGLSSEVDSSPSIALEIARNFLKQGYPIRAESALASASLQHATAGERLILEVEIASLRIYRDVMIKEAIAAAEAAFANVNSSIDLADLAEAERVRTRILLIAGTYYEITPEATEKARWLPLFRALSGRRVRVGCGRFGLLL